jgi:glycosyltransferase involved in cell wall biosynthesis
MEPTRGFPEMMEAVAVLQRRYDDLHTIIVGAERVAYGKQLQSGSWKKRMLNQLTIDLDRVHFTGLVSRKDMIKIFQASDVHLYLTVPFVLSWSALEAMSCGCLIVANDTEPVREFMTHEQNALLVNMDNAESIVEGLERALDQGNQLQALRRRAREIVVSVLDAKTIAFPKTKAFFEGLLAS